MKRQATKKLEIFLLFALRREAAISAVAPKADSETEDAKDGTSEEIFSVFTEQLNVPDNEKFERLRLNYQNKSEAEKQKWRERTQASIGADEPTIDDNIHRSRVEAALSREIPAIQKIIYASLSAVYRIDLKSDLSEPENAMVKPKSAVAGNLERIVRQTFAARFVALRDLPQAKTFDRLSGAQLARLVRLAGIREVAFACAQIKAVEAVGAFLRRFAPEDARSIAAQLSSLPKISGDRLLFAETLVQDALEIEPQPASAMLDWLGIRLVGILLCVPEESAARIAYAEQKLPLEAAPRLSEIIETQCRRTPDELKKKIGAEIERLAETIADSGVKIV